MNNALVRDNTVLEKLYSFLRNNSELNPLMASFFTKVVGSIISRNTEHVII
jgi:serine/threonine-protein phosphatase 6 regulatory subunit 3